MLFNSLTFLVFLAVVLGLYYSLTHRAQNLLLVLASYVFYGAWDWRFLALLWISTVVDYLCALKLAQSQHQPTRRAYMAISVATNLGILGFFKYCNFFVESFADLVGLFGIEANVSLLHVVLPVGISFDTFQTLSYTIDVYRQQISPTRNMIDFAVYVAYFPQLVAGPIERASRLLPQIAKPRRVDQQMISSGAQLMLLGYLKKVGIADSIAPYVEEIFSAPASQSSPELLVGLYLFAIQIYCDFSGYSDIARGVSRLLGIELMVNFKQPYLARNITEFWRRWHISLSTWLRDYVYIPLGGNRGGARRTYINLMLTMLIGGLWHGASWTFVVWGGLHGTYLIVHRLARGRHRDLTFEIRTPSQFIAYLVATLATFHLVCLTWLFFRAADFSQAWAYLRQRSLSTRA